MLAIVWPAFDDYMMTIITYNFFEDDEPCWPLCGLPLMMMTIRLSIYEDDEPCWPLCGLPWMIRMN